MRQNTKEEREFRGDAGALSPEEKILVVNAWKLLEDTRERNADIRGMDMTWRMQLRSDCRALEKALLAVEKNPGPRTLQKLQTAYTILETSAENILKAAESEPRFL